MSLCIIAKSNRFLLVAGAAWAIIKVTYLCVCVCVCVCVWGGGGGGGLYGGNVVGMR